MVKIFETLERAGPAMMDSLHEEKRVGTSAGICDWTDKPTTAAEERIPGGGEPHTPKFTPGLGPVAIERVMNAQWRCYPVVPDCADCGGQAQHPLA